MLQLGQSERRRAPALAYAAAHDSAVDRPQTSYAWNDGTALAYQVVGTSGPDLLLIPGSVSHLEVLWDEPRVHRFLTRFAAFCRLIIMDPRGLGLSDRLTEIPTMEERVDDLLSVLDAAESERATLFGNADTGPPCIAAAVSHPERVGGLILCGTYARPSRSDDYPWGWTEEEWADFRQFVKDDWGTTVREASVAPSMAGDTAFLQWSATLMRLGASPRAILLLAEMTKSVDVRPLLPQIAVPTLVHTGSVTASMRWITVGISRTGSRGHDGSSCPETTSCCGQATPTRSSTRWRSS